MRTNPFTVRGRINRCWLFTWRTAERLARECLPAPLEPVTFKGYAFWNAVVCRITSMRPWPLPSLLGIRYWHVAYRLYARAKTASGENVEGLYFVRSDCDQAWLATAGNCLTDFRFHAAQIDVTESDSEAEGWINAPGAKAHFHLQRQTAPSLSSGSPFASVEEASAFLKYKPCGLSPCGSEVINVLRIVRREDEWRSKPVVVQSAQWEFFDRLAVEPELCWEVAPINYQWNRGQMLRTQS